MLVTKYSELRLVPWTSNDSPTLLQLTRLNDDVRTHQAGKITTNLPESPPILPTFPEAIVRLVGTEGQQKEESNCKPIESLILDENVVIAAKSMNLLVIVRGFSTKGSVFAQESNGDVVHDNQTKDFSVGFWNPSAEGWLPPMVRGFVSRLFSLFSNFLLSGLECVDAPNNGVSNLLF